MNITDRGSGFPLILIPGLHGRWEYMSRAVGALAGVCRVITFSLCDEPAAGCRFDRTRGFDNFVDQVEKALDERGVPRAAISGWSFGGLIALAFAARRPERTTAVIPLSAPGPRWHLSREHEMYASRPWLFAPLFFAGVPGRLRAELTEAFTDRRELVRFAWDQMRTFLRAPIVPSRMAGRAKMIGPATRTIDFAAIAAPTLIVTGEPRLDRVVPVEGTSEYLDVIRGSRLARLEHTGHFGCLTHPRELAAVVRAFLDESRHAAA